LEKPILAENLEINVKDEINQQFNQKLENDYKMYLLTSSQWQSLRQKFIDQRKVNAVTSQPENNNNPADLARSIFGDDVEVRG
jgi:hypothetical protein